MLHIVDTVHEVVVGNGIEDIAEDRLFFAETAVRRLKRIDEGIADSGYLLRTGAFPTVEKNVGLILHTEGGESELRRAIGVLRRGHELIEVFFEVDAGRKETKENKQRNHRHPKSCAMIAEKTV